MPPPPPAVRRTAVPRVLLRLTAGALTAAALLLGPGMTAASAHDELVGTTPASDATVGSPPAQVTLEFSGALQALGTQVLVSGPDGAQASQGAVELAGTTVTQPLSDDLPAGTYTVEWRATSADGHPLSGTFTFAVAAGASAATSPAEAVPADPVRESASAGPTSPGPSGVSAPMAWTAAGAVLAAAGVLGVRRIRRRP